MLEESWRSPDLLAASGANVRCELAVSVGSGLPSRAHRPGPGCAFVFGPLARGWTAERIKSQPRCGCHWPTHGDRRSLILDAVSMRLSHAEKSFDE